jgi:integrase
MPENAKFCPACGIKQDISRRPKSRGNGQGTVYQLPDKTWIARITTGYAIGEDGNAKRQTRSKQGFKTKKDALDYLPVLRAAADAPKPKNPAALTLEQLYNVWAPTHKAGKSTMDGYKYAFRYFSSLWETPIAEITIDDLQECMDECQKGKRTRENMKALGGLLYKYAVPRGYAALNLAQYLVVNGGEKGKKEALPEDAVAKLEQAVGKVPGADYILAQCYLGFRPSEFLALTIQDYDPVNRAFTGGAKTDAGKNRTVTVSPKIQPIIDGIIAKRSSGPMFADASGGPLNLKRYSSLMYSALEAVGVENPIVTVAGVERHRYTPHSCRHTFATMMKRVAGADKDKLELMGHTSAEMLRHYQDVDYDDLRKITDLL